jgi:hypothetical protein
MRANRLGQRAVMAMAATGILTALAPAPAALADDEARATSAKSVDLGVTTVIGDQVVSYAYTELNSDRKLENPAGSNCNFYSNLWSRSCRPWAADFVKWVWYLAGVYGFDVLDATPASTVRYGRTFNVWHPGSTLAGIYPGASVVYNSTGDPAVHSDHVGIFVGVVNETQKVISGNYNNQVYKHNLHYGTPVAGWTGVG